MTDTLPSEEIILTSPMSWTGATVRIWRYMDAFTATSHGWRKAGWVTLLWTALVLAWIGVALYYAVLAFFGLIPLIILIGYRVTRRAQRTGERNALRHQEIITRDQR